MDRYRSDLERTREAAHRHVATELTRDEVLRYSRHILIPEVGISGQERLRASKVLCIGAGGLGSPVAMYLAAAGVGTLGIVDFDVVDATNLQRQILHGTSDIGRSKLASAVETLADINPHIDIVPIEARLSSANALGIIGEYDIVVDGSDNFPTRYLVNDACVLTGRPDVYGAVFRFEGQAAVFAAPGGPCYRCLYPVPPPPGTVPSCAEAGVLGVIPGVIGAIQATETLKLILGLGEPLVGALLLFDALKMEWRRLSLRRNRDCPICGAKPTIHELIDYEAFCGTNRGGKGSTVPSPTVAEITVRELKARFDRGDRPLLLDVREPHEVLIATIPYATPIPMGQIPERIGELDPDAEAIVYCRSGIRSMQIAQFLVSEGFKRVANLRGGVLAWSEEVDPSVPKY